MRASVWSRCAISAGPGVPRTVPDGSGAPNAPTSSGDAAPRNEPTPTPMGNPGPAGVAPTANGTRKPPVEAGAPPTVGDPVRTAPIMASGGTVPRAAPTVAPGGSAPR